MLLTHVGESAVPDVASARALIRAGAALEVTIAKAGEGAEAQPTKLRIRGR